MKKLIIFAGSEMQSLMKYYFESTGEYQVLRFTMNHEHLEKISDHTVPKISWEDLISENQLKDHYLYIGIGYGSMNKIREKKYLEAKKAGFKFASYISPMANILTDDIGENNFILEDNTIQPFVKIGNNNIIWSGNHIGHHSIIGNNNFISSHVVIAGGVTIKNNTFLGINSTIRDHITVEDYTLIGGNAWISRDTEQYGVYLSGEATKINKKSFELKI